MAPHADEPREGIAARILRLLEPNQGRLAYAARLALICALTTIIVEVYQTPSAALTVYVVFFLNKPDRAASVVLAVAFVVLLTLMLAFLLLIATIVLDSPLWRVVAMTLISFALLFLTSASKLRPVGAILALIAVYALDLLGAVPGGEIA